MIFHIIIFTPNYAYVSVLGAMKSLIFTMLQNFTTSAYFIIASYCMKTRLNYKIHKYTSLRRIYYSNSRCRYPQKEIVQNVKLNTISFF